jgi:NAD(P)-dependent dehydrogenase (short-subunit alcohol dehydrogenase family)
MNAAGRLAGKTALITGAASGMGKTAALRFAREGAAVVVADISEQGEKTAAEISAADGEALFIRADVAEEQQVETMVQKALDSFGHLDVIYNNAGIGPPDDAAIHELPTAVWDRVMNINVRGMYLCCRFGIKAILDQSPAGPASIVNTASIAGLVGNSTLPSTAYTVSKGAVMALTKQVAVSYAANGIRCNALCPGPIRTPILEPFFAEPGVRERFEQRIPIGRMGEPEDVASLALFLASDESSFITGALIVIDGGITAT